MDTPIGQVACSRADDSRATSECRYEACEAHTEIDGPVCPRFPSPRALGSRRAVYAV
jgi:hypothetical protein